MSDQNLARDHKMAAHKTKREQENDIKNAHNPRQARYLRELQSYNGDPLTGAQHLLHRGANVSTRERQRRTRVGEAVARPAAQKKRKTNGRGASKAPTTKPPAVQPASRAGVPERAQEDDGADAVQPTTNGQNQQQTRRPPHETPKARVTAKEDWAVGTDQAQTTTNHTAPPPPPSILGPSTPSPGMVQRSMRNMQPLQLADVPTAPGSLANSVKRTKEGRKWNKKSEKKQHEHVRKSLGRAKTPDF